MNPGLLDDRESDVIDLRQLWVALGRRKAVILATTVLAVIAALVITTVATPVYEAVTTLLVKDPRAAGERMFLDTGTSAVARNQVQNSVEMLRSRQVALRAAERLGYSFSATDSAFAMFHSSISVQPVPNTETIRVIVRRPSPEEAAAIANSVAESFIELSRELNHGEVSAAREFIEEQLAVAEAQLQAEERVRFIGWMDNPYPLVRSADVALVCSRSEGFGRVTVEAMLAGKPVVGARAGATPELVREGFNGLLYAPGDAADLARQVAVLHEQPERAREMGEAGRRWASQRFTVERYAAEVAEVLRAAAVAKRAADAREQLR